MMLRYSGPADACVHQAFAQGRRWDDDCLAGLRKRVDQIFNSLPRSVDRRTDVLFEYQEQDRSVDDHHRQ